MNQSEYPVMNKNEELGYLLASCYIIKLNHCMKTIYGEWPDTH